MIILRKDIKYHITMSTEEARVSLFAVEMLLQSGATEKHPQTHRCLRRLQRQYKDTIPKKMGPLMVPVSVVPERG